MSEAINYVPGEWYEAKTREELAAFFASRIPAIREAAREQGYAIGLHGSMRRDLDLIAVPWREGASDKDVLAHAIAVAACGITRDGDHQWEVKPLGRLATSLPCCWPSWYGEAGAGHIDLSVMAPQPAPAPHPAVPVVEAFAEGWKMAADWANRDDLLPDMDSPQYAKERDERLAELRPAVEPIPERDVVDAFCKEPHRTQYVSVFFAGVRFAEAHHGITAKAEGGA